MVLHLVRCLVDGVVVAVIGDVGPTRAGTISRERGPLCWACCSRASAIQVYWSPSPGKINGSPCHLVWWAGSLVDHTYVGVKGTLHLLSVKPSLISRSKSAYSSVKARTCCDYFCTTYGLKGTLQFWFNKFCRLPIPYIKQQGVLHCSWFQPKVGAEELPYLSLTD